MRRKPTTRVNWRAVFILVICLGTIPAIWLMMPDRQEPDPEPTEITEPAEPTEPQRELRQYGGSLFDPPHPPMLIRGRSSVDSIFAEVIRSHESLETTLADRRTDSRSLLEEEILENFCTEFFENYYLLQTASFDPRRARLKGLSYSGAIVLNHVMHEPPLLQADVILRAFYLIPISKDFRPANRFSLEVYETIIINPTP